ncbi:sigma-70 family RNA polymerase sigma factor [Segetibacter sp. 3557_3]|uniref:RNA polymerase sigma factor n=1 Tax=Segetibacter sp. 3557_3 TaxID=2547429 RepID=UPI001058F72D|nr:sigma-70 family RNA polymerase sigma factor [Segetibacter sp. 3557_3]TDH27960.1 sigma-70 family RNA polymerase sigma factor [Segetibacter sp. 3557_3]
MADHYQLVKDCLKGKPKAQRELYETFAPLMLGVCYRYTKSTQDAEDILQDGFVKVFRFLHQYKREAELGAWIRKIMVNTALNYLKQSKRYQNDLLYDKTDLHVVAHNDTETQLNVKELAELIRQLPTGYQTIFNLYAVEGYTHVEIGAMLGISENTSRSQYMRARNLLISWINNTAGNKNRVYAN